MSRRSRSKGQAPAPASDQVVSLELLEGKITAAGGPLPSDASMIRAIDRMLRIASGAPGPFATVVCEPTGSGGGLRVVQGAAAVRAARSLRARALRDGNTAWARMIGRRLQFRIVVMQSAGDAGAA